MRPNKCQCGSGVIEDLIYDARGIYVFASCEYCHKEKKANYRADIWTNPNYPSSEDIDPD